MLETVTWTSRLCNWDTSHLLRHVPHTVSTESALSAGEVYTITLICKLQVYDTDTAAQPTNQAAIDNSTANPIFADLFDHSTGQNTPASPSSRGSFSFCMPAADNNENAEPNSNPRMQPHTEVPSLPKPKPLAQSPGLTAGDTEHSTAAQQAVQEEQKQYTTPRRRRGGWGTPQAVQNTHAADHSAAAGLAKTAKQGKQVLLPGSTSASPRIASACVNGHRVEEDLTKATVTSAPEPQERQGCAALVDDLALAVDLGDHAWQDAAAALRRRADALDSADCYDAHMEMGTMLASR